MLAIARGGMGEGGPCYFYRANVRPRRSQQTPDLHAMSVLVATPAGSRAANDRKRAAAGVVLQRLRGTCRILDVGFVVHKLSVARAYRATTPGDIHEICPPSISAIGSERARTAGTRPPRERADLSVAAGASARRLCRRWC